MPTPRTPRFTRSHFDWIARVIAELNDDDNISHEDVRSLFANELARTNPRFNVGQFLLTCSLRSRPRVSPHDEVAGPTPRSRGVAAGSPVAISTPTGTHAPLTLRSHVYQLDELDPAIVIPPWSRPTPTAGDGWEFLSVRDTISREHETNLDNDHGEETTGEWRTVAGTAYSGVSVAPVHRYNFRRRVVVPVPTPIAPAPEYRIQSEGWRYLNSGEILDRTQDEVNGLDGWESVGRSRWVSPGSGEERLFRRPYRQYRIVPDHPHLRFLNEGERLCFATDMWLGCFSRRLDPLNRHAWADGQRVDDDTCNNFVRPLYRPVPGRDGWRYLEPGEVPIAGQDRIVCCWDVCLGVAGPHYTVESDRPTDSCRGIEYFARQLTFPLPHSAGATPPQVNTFYGVHPARSTRPIRPLPLP